MKRLLDRARRWAQRAEDPAIEDPVRLVSPSFEDLRAELDALRRSYHDAVGLLQSIDGRASLQHTAFLALAQDIVIHSDRRCADERSLSRVYGQVYSQNFEDGIISEIFSRIGTTSRSFVEIGVGDGSENNTRLLLDLEWSGTWFESASQAVSVIRRSLSRHIENGTLKLIEGYVTRDAISQQIAECVQSEEFDFLSIDIDYNTSHVWSALRNIRPRVVCIEYNAHYPADVDFEVPYDASETWAGTTRFGASLKALERIGYQLGYCLVGCDILGINAFFVRQDLCDETRFLPPFTAKQHYQPPRFSWVHMRGHARHI